MVWAQIKDVPEDWVEEADEMEISVAEYCRRMVRAGRRQFGQEYSAEEVPKDPATLKTKNEPTGDVIEVELEKWIYNNLSTDEAQDVEDLVSLLEGEITVLADNLCDKGKAKYRRSKGGYLKEENDA